LLKPLSPAGLVEQTTQRICDVAFRRIGRGDGVTEIVCDDRSHSLYEWTASDSLDLVIGPHAASTAAGRWCVFWIGGF